MDFKLGPVQVTAIRIFLNVAEDPRKARRLPIRR
jgi:hypothetical protein